LLKIILPYPPSVNTYWGFQGSRRFLTPRASAFKKIVAIEYKLTEHPGFDAQRLKAIINLYPPDKRKRDIDNVIKSLLDALCQAGVFKDDSQFDRIEIERKSLIKNGKTEIIIEPFSIS
jgi:crossover junction endodeoxyribonuclease RusA